MLNTIRRGIGISGTCARTDTRGSSYQRTSTSEPAEVMESLIKPKGRPREGGQEGIGGRVQNRALPIFYNHVGISRLPDAACLGEADNILFQFWDTVREMELDVSGF